MVGRASVTHGQQLVLRLYATRAHLHRAKIRTAVTGTGAWPLRRSMAMVSTVVAHVRRKCSSLLLVCHGVRGR